MKQNQPDSSELSPEAAAWSDRIVEDAAGIRLPALFRDKRDGAAYRVADRGGVAVVAFPTSALSQDELVQLMRYRLAQYIATDFVDCHVVYEQGLEYEPLDAASADDIHIVAGSAETGELFCYSVVEAPPAAPPETRVRDRERPLFPVEQVHGWGIYNSLRILPDLPVSKVRELGRFVKNQSLPPIADEGIRAPVEVFLAACRLVTGPLTMEIDALVGDFEEAIVKQNLEFFHVPMVIIHGTVPYLPQGSLLYPRYQYRTVYPFACLTLDGIHALPRLDEIDEALSQPGTLGLIQLVRARDERPAVKSSLEPPAGLPELAKAAVPQEGVPMETRHELLTTGARLRNVDLFAGLSDAEAAILGSCMERIEAQQGTAIVRQGDVGDTLYVIEEGEADVMRRGRSGAGQVVARLGPGAYFGEISVVTGGERIADVVAATPMVLRRLSKDDYVRYLGGIAEIAGSLTRTGLTRADATTLAGNSQDST